MLSDSRAPVVLNEIYIFISVGGQTNSTINIGMTWPVINKRFGLREVTTLHNIYTRIEPSKLRQSSSITYTPCFTRCHFPFVPSAYMQHPDADVGGWGPWSDWTPCSTTCAGGTKNRYRVCDSPPPRYGAKFCQVSERVCFDFRCFAVADFYFRFGDSVCAPGISLSDRIVS